MAEEDFFKDKYFDALSKRFDTIEVSLGDMRGKVDSIQSKVNYMYAFAAGVGFIASLIWNWLSSKFYTPHG